MMNEVIENIVKIRKAVIACINELSTAQLNEIPAGFNNNIIWNLGHLIAAQQGLCYFRSGVEMPVGLEFFNQYKADTKPEVEISEEAIANIKELFFSSLEQLEPDYDNHLFDQYQAYVNRYGIELNNIDKTLQYIFFHEGVHYGYIMALKRAVLKNI